MIPCLDARENPAEVLPNKILWKLNYSIKLAIKSNN